MSADNFLPPSHPPPILNEEQVLQLAQTGSLPLDLPPPLSSAVEELFNLSHNFFTLPPSTKETHYPAAEGTELGYYHIPNEKEYLTYRHHPLSTLPPQSSLDSACSRFWSLAATFLHRILSDLSLALDIPLSAWSPLLDGCLSMPSSQQATTPTLLRLFNYFPASGAAERHTDTGLLTLCIGTAPGLEVWCPDPNPNPGPSSPTPQAASWTSLHPRPVILVGKTLQWLSNGRLHAGLHRVIAAPEGRQSIVFALRPSLRRRYFDLSAFGESRVVDLVGVWAQIRGSVFNVNAQRGIREGQKERMRERGLWSADEEEGGKYEDGSGRPERGGEKDGGRDPGFG
ncbi:MAG: hypothetical protein LQ338_002621 [Usnochroma carphineum]|nr:MAG: hypothetical protein LQ338_002621 [Usnochroma carphineum]